MTPQQEPVQLRSISRYSGSLQSAGTPSTLPNVSLTHSPSHCLSVYLSLPPSFSISLSLSRSLSLYLGLCLCFSLPVFPIPLKFIHSYQLSHFLSHALPLASSRVQFICASISVRMLCYQSSPVESCHLGILPRLAPGWHFNSCVCLHDGVWEEVTRKLGECGMAFEGFKFIAECFLRRAG